MKIRLHNLILIIHVRKICRGNKGPRSKCRNKLNVQQSDENKQLGNYEMAYLQYM